MTEAELAFDSMKAIMNVASGFYSLKKVLKTDVGSFEREILYRVGVESGRLYLDRHADEAGPADPIGSLQYFLKKMASDSVGSFRLLRFDQNTMVAEVAAESTVESVGFREYGDVQKSVSCSYTAGFIAAICRRAFASVPEVASCTEALEVECAAGSERHCRFLAGPRAELEALGHKVISADETISDHALKLNEDILAANLELQNTKLSLERQAIKRAEDLRKAEINFRSMIDLSPDAVLVAHHDGRIDIINTGGVRMFAHVRPEDIEGRNFSTLLAEGTVAWDRLVWALDKEGTVRGTELKFLRKDGKAFPGEMSAGFTENHVERLIQMVIRDVADKTSHQDELREAKRESGFYNALLSHDVANHLSAGMRFAEALKKSPHLSEDDRKNLEMVEKNLKGAFELAAVVRDTSRAVALGEDECEVKDIGHAMMEAIEDAKRLYSTRKVRIEFRESAEKCFARGNMLLSRMFSNILTNAIKFDPHQEAVIDVAVDSIHEAGVGYWRVKVSDRGKGIREEDKKRIFDRFYKGDSAAPGAGLGLFLVARLIHVCRGSIWAEDRVPGDPSQGTVMVVLLEKAVQN